MSQPTLVLAGGGHTHALLLRRLIRHPLPNVRVILVSDHAMAPYTGMLPGLIAGHYEFAEMHIDLPRLCQRAGVAFHQGRVTGLDPNARQLFLADQPALSYDLISINTGATPTADISGADRFALGVKPVNDLYQQWLLRLRTLEQSASAEPQHWGVVGAGAGGVELVLAMAHRIRQLSPNAPRVHWHLLYRGPSILPGYPKRLKRKAEHALAQARIQCHPEFNLKSIAEDHLTAADGTRIPMQHTILCTPVTAPQWPQTSGLATANGGFIAVNEYLQSTSHPTLFAVGDVAEMVTDPRPKAGVYAVRQARYLSDNVRRSLAGQPLRPMHLQRQFLSLLALGGKTAVGRRGPFTFSGAWVWYWKNWIDRDFMRLFK